MPHIPQKLPAPTLCFWQSIPFERGEWPCVLFCCTLTLLLCTLTAGNALAEHRLGGGVNYWVMLKDLDDKDFDDKGLSYLVSYQYWKGPFGVELAGELLPKRLDETALAPQAYLLFGGTLYAGGSIKIGRAHV